jgi:N-hydroxyarylamine O-acetyltransferase
LQQVLDETFGVTPPASADEIFAVIIANAGRR